MSRLFLSVCSRTEKRGSCLSLLNNYTSVLNGSVTSIEWDAPSIYEGHSRNIERTPKNDDDIIVMVHDDVEILSKYEDFRKYLSICNLPGVGFVGVAGSTTLGKDPVWWAGRAAGESRGFVFQGDNSLTMMPNYFGTAGKVVVMDGCFLACSYKTLKSVGLEKPDYLSSNWDFYDIHLTTKAYLMGLTNYVVPILIRHESIGEMRKDWYTAKQEFAKHHNQNLPLKISGEATYGLPN